MTMSEKKKLFNTKVIHSGHKENLETGAVMPPIHLSSTFKQKSPGNFKYEYSRTNNPTRDKLVGDSIDNDEESTEAIQIVPKDPSKPFDEAQMQLKKGMSLVEEGSKLIEEAQTKMQEIASDMMSKMPTEHVGESTKNSIKEELLAKLKASK